MMKKVISVVLLAGYLSCPTSFAANSIAQKISSVMPTVSVSRQENASQRVEQKQAVQAAVIDTRAQATDIRRKSVEPVTEVIADVYTDSGARVIIEIKKPNPSNPSVGATHLVVTSIFGNTKLVFSLNERTSALTLTRTVNGRTSSEVFEVGNNRAGIRLTMMYAAIKAVEKRIPLRSNRKFENFVYRMFNIMMNHGLQPA